MNPENYINHLYWGQCQSPMSSIFNSQLINAGLAAQMGSPVSFSDIPVGSPLGQGFQSTFSPYSPNNDFNLPETHQSRQALVDCLNRFNYDSNLHPLHQPHRFQQNPSTMLPYDSTYPSSSTPVPSHSVPVANPPAADEEVVIDVRQNSTETGQPKEFKSRDRLSKDAYRDQFKPVTFTCKFDNGDGQQCGQTFPAILSYLSRYQETSLFRDNFHTISFDFN